MSSACFSSGSGCATVGRAWPTGGRGHLYRRGDVVAVGVNEVPRAGGGLYWEGDSGDGREVTLGSDTNLRHRHEISEDIAERLHANGLLPENADTEKVLECVEGSALGDIIEFMRAVHAEMAALMDAARRGSEGR